MVQKSKEVGHVINYLRAKFQISVFNSLTYVYARFNVVAAVLLKIRVFRDVTSSRQVNSYRRFRRHSYPTTRRQLLTSRLVVAY